MLTWVAVHPSEKVADEPHHLGLLQPPQRCLQDGLIVACRQRRMQAHLLCAHAQALQTLH